MLKLLPSCPLPKFALKTSKRSLSNPTTRLLTNLSATFSTFLDAFVDYLKPITNSKGKSRADVKNFWFTNPTKTEAAQRMKSPGTLNQCQRVNGLQLTNSRRHFSILIFNLHLAASHIYLLRHNRTCPSQWWLKNQMQLGWSGSWTIRNLPKQRNLLNRTRRIYQSHRKQRHLSHRKQRHQSQMWREL